MIFPIINGIGKYAEVPITWLLVFINVVFFFSFSSKVSDQNYLNSLYEDELFLKSQGQLYAQMIQDKPKAYSNTLVNLSRQSLNGDRERSILLGTMALRSNLFIEKATSYPFKGDPVTIKWWKEKFLKIQSIRKTLPSHLGGLSFGQVNFSRWLSYQFIHGGVFHLFWNMIFLLIFGTALEAAIGHLAFLVVYLGTGVLAAMSFLMASGPSAVHLIGASGSVSGIMAMYCFLYWKKPVSYFYFLFIPHPRFMGIVLLPAWIFLAVLAAGDLAGILSYLPEIGGVAYAAHIGGQLSGVLLGAIKKYFV